MLSIISKLGCFELVISPRFSLHTVISEERPIFLRSQLGIVVECTSYVCISFSVKCDLILLCSIFA